MSRFPNTAMSRTLASLLTACGIATVMVLSTMGTAWAEDTPTNPTPAPKQNATPRPSDWEAPTGTHIKTNPKDLDQVVVYGGAVHGPGDAQWTDHDTSAPELPVARR